MKGRQQPHLRVVERLIQFDDLCTFLSKLPSNTVLIRNNHILVFASLKRQDEQSSVIHFCSNSIIKHQ